MRALDVHTGELLGAWSFEKSVPGRMEPLDFETAGFEPPAAGWTDEQAREGAAEEGVA